MDPIRELPYGPAACNQPHKRPDTCQHLTTRRAASKKILAPPGASIHVHDDNVAFRERGNEKVFHPFFEEDGIDWTIIDFRRHETAKAQPRNQRDRLVVAMRHCGTQPLSAPAASGFSGQIGRGAGLVDEHKRRRRRSTNFRLKCGIERFRWCGSIRANTPRKGPRYLDCRDDRLGERNGAQPGAAGGAIGQQK